MAVLLFTGAALTGVVFFSIGQSLADAMLPAASMTVTALHLDYTIHELRIDRNMRPEWVIFTKPAAHPPPAPTICAPCGSGLKYKRC